MNVAQILIAEDDLEDRYIMQETFKELGHPEVLKFVENGVLLLDYLTKQPNDVIGLIVLDLNMPLQTGTETLRLLKAQPQYADIPVIIFSTSVNEYEKKICFELGAIDYKVKPLAYADYLELCNEFYRLSNHAV